MQEVLQRELGVLWEISPGALLLPRLRGRPESDQDPDRQLPE